MSGKSVHEMDLENLRKKYDVLQDAAIQAEFALMDWARSFAPEQCDEDDVARTRSRIDNRGGTLTYISETRLALLDALIDGAPK